MIKEDVGEKNEAGGFMTIKVRMKMKKKIVINNNLWEWIKEQRESSDERVG